MINQLRKNIIKSWITSVVAVVIYIITTVLIWKGAMSFVWEGIAGYTLGTILLLTPDSIARLVSKAIDKKIKVDNDDGNESC